MILVCHTERDKSRVHTVISQFITVSKNDKMYLRLCNCRVMSLNALVRGQYVVRQTGR